MVKHMSRKYHQGIYKIKNREKYLGDPDNIVYRSSWELKMLQFLDKTEDIINFSSEEIVIPYVSPADGKYHRYFPDFFVKVKQKDGTLKSMILEVKPHAQTIEPKVKKRVTKGYINEVVTYGVNQAKWKAAREYCLDRGWEFRTITEFDIGIK
jgi:hypothetical protein